MPVRGNFAKLSRFARACREVGRTEDLNRNLAEAALDKVKETFERQAAPGGAGWAPTQRGGRILQDTGRLKGSFKVASVSARGFTVSSSVSYGVYHQSGTRYMPARKMVPDGELPGDWMDELEHVAELFLKSKFSGL